MSLVYFLVLIGVLVSVHELGHFTAAKLLDVKVLRFSLGFGPAVARVRGRETEYQLGIVPLGGYVRLLGEDPAEAIPARERARAFAARPLWHRLVIVFAGPAANLLCPLLIYLAFFAGHRELPAAVIGDVLAGGPAEAAGLRPGDRVLAVNGDEVRYWEELEAAVDAAAGRTIRLTLRRDGQKTHAFVTPLRQVVRQRDGRAVEEGLIGVTQAPFPARIGVLGDDSPAGRAGLRTGDLVISVDGAPIDRGGDLDARLARRQGRAAIAYLRPRRAHLSAVEIRLLEPALTDLVPDVIPTPEGRPRIETGLCSAELVVARVEAGSPAERAGLRAGDVITALDGAPVQHWFTFDQALQAAPDRPHAIGWRRAGPAGPEEHVATVTQERGTRVDEYGHGYAALVFGATNDHRPGGGEMVPIDGRIVYATTHALERTGGAIVEMVRGLGALLSGERPSSQVGGPLMVYRIASVSGEKGWDSFLLMIALISTNLGLINLLPIPVLDGGHLVLFAVEAVRRRKLSPRLREAVVTVGLVLIVAMTVLGLRNDIVRYLLH